MDTRKQSLVGDVTHQRVLVEYDTEKEEHYIVSDLFEKAGFKEGDTVQWSSNGDGSWVITKIKEENNKND